MAGSGTLLLQVLCLTLMPARFPRFLDHSISGAVAFTVSFRLVFHISAR